MTDRLAVLPTLPSERVGSLDVVRGAAVIGSVPLIIQSFGTAMVPFTVPQNLSDLNSVSGLIRLFEYIFIEFKILPLLSLVYGASIVLMCERLDNQDRALSNIPHSLGKFITATRLHTLIGHSSTAFVLRRCLALLVIGALTYFLSGSSTFVIALVLAGFFAFLMRRWPTDQLGKIGAGWLIAGSVSLIISGLLLDWTGFAYPQSHLEGLSLSTASAANLPGGWLEQVKDRVGTATDLQTLIPLLVNSIFHFGIMLIGMALAKSRYIAAQCPTKSYGLYAISGLMIGVPLALISVIAGVRSDWEISSVLMLSAPLHYWASVCLVSSYISILMILCRTSSLRWLKRYLACVGRLALSNFVIASAIYVFLFSRSDLGLDAQFTLEQKAIGAVGLALLSIAASRLWSWYFCIGPVEWVLRALTYGFGAPLTTRRWAPA